MRFSQMAGVLMSVFVFVPMSWAAEQVTKSTASDQVSVEVTAYNSDLALIKDVRQVKLEGGEGFLQFMDVASSIQPETVRVRSVDHPEQLEFLEQNYEYDLISPQKLLEKYVGKKIKLSAWNQYQDRKEVVEAILLSVNNGPVYQIGGEIHLGHEGTAIVPELPDNLFARPTLSWLYQNRTAQTHRVETSYLASKISWRADYALVLNDKDTRGDLSGWVTLDNRSGATYTQAKLKLVAGDVHLPEERARSKMEYVDYSLASSPEGAGFQEQSLFEYHLYDLQRPTTIRENQTKQISLLDAPDIAIKKELRFYGASQYYRSQLGTPLSNQKVGVFLEIENDEKHRLGIPLPKGTVRVYKAAGDQSLQFIGEDVIDHTPKDEKVKIKMGDAFDVVGERTQRDWKKIAWNLYETEWDVELRNHKTEDVEVTILEPVPGDWEVVKSSHPYSKIEAHTLQYAVKVPGGGKTTVNYRVRMRW